MNKVNVEYASAQNTELHMQLRDICIASGKGPVVISRESGVNYATTYQFITDNRQMTLKNYANLAAYFGRTITLEETSDAKYSV